jgi:2',3'-cyclic-nucleotide 3'-phosphodiesterase
MQRRLVIMRGLPGSGKSTKARRLAEESGRDYVILSTDDFFVGGDGVYRFDAKRIVAAHKWNHVRARTFMSAGYPLVIIDNTNTQAWESREYCRAARVYGYAVEFCEADTPWAFDVPTLARKNAHGCSQKAIARMAARWQHGLTVDQCINAKAPWD